MYNPTMKLSLLLLLAASASAVPRAPSHSSAVQQTTKPAFVKKTAKGWTSLTTDVQGVSRGGDNGRPGDGTATMSNEMFNLVKAVLGVGVLSLPAG